MMTNHRWQAGRLAGGILLCAFGGAAEVIEFRKDIAPVLQQYCYDCHGDGMNRGGVDFDEFNPAADLADSRDLWLRVLNNLRAGMMPPPKRPHPAPAEKERIEHWIKSQVFDADPANPDPGRVTLRRLNRIEYRNTIRDLMEVDYDTNTEFPPDDTGHGFDNIGDVLTLSPMLLEKYLDAAQTIVGRAVPFTARVVREQVVPGQRFQSDRTGDPGGRQRAGGPLSLSFYSPAAVSNTFNAARAGRHQLVVNLVVSERYVDNLFDYNRCRLTFTVNGQEQFQREFSWEGGRSYRQEIEVDWPAGNHELALTLEPLTPDEPQTRSLSVQLSSVTVRGPLTPEHWVKPANYDRFFPKTVPEDVAGRRAYAGELLGRFAGKAYRRPADEATVARLADLAESIYPRPGKTFEEGVAQAMVAVLASPRFLFREEGVEVAAATARDGESYPYVDEYALASRLSYFLWSSMPDDELFRLAGQGKLRANLSAQLQRLLADRRSEAFIRNFTGQWLHARDIESIPIDARAVFRREERAGREAEQARQHFRQLNNQPESQLTEAERRELETLRNVVRQRNRQPPRAELTPDLRRDLRRETERYFDFVLREDRNLLELLDSDYTFLNERLAAHYGVPNVTGNDLRRVTLPADSPRGGVLTQGTVLAVTSNPTRTSPVKRGVFILENILGTPPPPPPPDIPPLEDAAKEITGRVPTLREMLALHRANPSCSSCHNRMDPLGLAFENFNALGLWRDQEYDEPVDAAGQLITGEQFSGVKELKRILVEHHATAFYRTVTEKLLTYALGRGLDYHDVQTVDNIVAEIEQAQGRPSALLRGVVESAPFQKTRRPEPQTAALPDSPDSEVTPKTGLHSGHNELKLSANHARTKQ